MGPPPFGDGKLYNPVDLSMRMEWLQWGHRLSAMERRHRVPTGARGNRRFNGATAFRRWKVIPMRYRVVPGRNASMGPPPFGDGKNYRTAIALHYITASMGPPPFGDGKSGAAPREPYPGTQASMGPPPFGDGKLRPSVFGPVKDDGFNGATAFRRWKAVATMLERLQAGSLQWGHRLSAMESGSGPRRNGIGTSLQWGHRLSAMESTGNPHRIPPGRDGLQWGHRLSAMERTTGSAPYIRWGGASMGPPPFGDGKLADLVNSGT